MQGLGLRVWVLGCNGAARRCVGHEVSGLSLRGSRSPLRSPKASADESKALGFGAVGWAALHVGSVSKLGSLLGPFFIRVPYCFGDSERDPNLESYPCGHKYWNWSYAHVQTRFIAPEDPFRLWEETGFRALDH